VEKLDNPLENPLSVPEAGTHGEVFEWFRSVPPAVLAIASALLLLIVVLVFFLR
jgi:hypothetical protein